MTSLRFLAVSALAVASLSCTKEATFNQPLPPLAGIHWVNAVPDTGEQDIRIVDIVSNAGLFNATFRASNMFYQPIEAGTRTVRVFNSSDDPAIASQVIGESSVSLTASNNYTVIHAGFARTGGVPARAVVVIPDAATAPAAGQIALRVINAAAGVAGGSVDVWFVRRPVVAAGPDSLPDTPHAAGVGFGTASAYTPFGRDSVAADSFRVVITAAGTKAPILATLKAPAGAAAGTNPPSDAIAGSRIGGSVMTAVFLPPSVAGSQAPQTAAFTTPAALYLVDRRPPTVVP
jgi:hypothetical protein